MKKKISGLLILLITYIVATFIGVLVFNSFKNQLPVWINLLVSDIVATVFVWIVGIFFKTASIYDPYWSVQTIIIYVLLMIEYKTLNFGNILYLLFIAFWAIRLTYNFIHGFNDISYIDWRYAHYREKTGKWYQLVSLLGIHLVPTIIVYFASLPAFMYVINGQEFNFLNIVGLIIMFIATMLELISDYNMIQFKKVRKSNKEIINIGLWKYSRHPNYLGEILFWYGVALVYILSVPSSINLIVGAIANTLLFLFISIPLQENHLKQYKEGFEDYKKITRMLLPIKK